MLIIYDNSIYPSNDLAKLIGRDHTYGDILMDGVENKLTFRKQIGKPFEEIHGTFDLYSLLNELNRLAEDTPILYLYAYTIINPDKINVVDNYLRDWDSTEKNIHFTKDGKFCDGYLFKSIDIFEKHISNIEYEYEELNSDLFLNIRKKSDLLNFFCQSRSIHYYKKEHYIESEEATNILDFIQKYRIVEPSVLESSVVYKLLKLDPKDTLIKTIEDKLVNIKEEINSSCENMRFDFDLVLEDDHLVSVVIQYVERPSIVSDTLDKWFVPIKKSKKIRMLDLETQISNKSLTVEEFKQMIAKLFRFFEERPIQNVSQFEQSKRIKEEFRESVIYEVGKLKKHPKYIEFDLMFISNTKYNSFDDLIMDYIRTFQDYNIKKDNVMVYTSGSLLLSNILYKKEQNEMLFIKMREAYLKNIYYDLGLISASICSSYESILKDQFHIVMDENGKGVLCLYQNPIYKDIFMDCIEDHGFDCGLVRLAEIAMILKNEFDMEKLNMKQLLAFSYQIIKSLNYVKTLIYENFNSY